MRWIVLLFVFLACAPAALAADDKAEVKALRIPVFFVTDRNRVDNGKGNGPVQFGTERQYRGICKHDPWLGVAYCTVKNIEHKSGEALCPQLGWEPVADTKEGPGKITLTEGADYETKKDKFWEQLYTESQKVESPHEVDVFVPGYMSTFESGLRSAARLAYYSERPVILYSWPSKGKFTAYTGDEATIEWSQEHFDDVLNELTVLSKRESPLRVRMYAHSMGNRLVLRSTPKLKASNALDEVAMICPDVDDGLVKHYASRYFERRGSTIIRLYESNADRMLRLSKLVHGGYARFGEDWEPLDLLVPKAAAAAKPATLAGTVSSTKTVSNILPKLPLPGPLYRRMQTIDFSQIDVGTVGHRIPVELICSLSRTNEPSHGLALEVVRPTKKSIDPNAPTPDASDGILKVVTTSKWRKLPLYSTIRQYRPRPTLFMTKDWTLK